MIQWYQGKVQGILQESPSVRRFFVEIQETSHFNFKAGQFVTFDLPIGEKRMQRWRSYSIANAPDGGNVIELCIVHVENGAASTYFFETVQVGTFLKFKGPDGAFCLPDKLNTHVVMICTGTGIAPFRSMILMLAKTHPSTNIHLIFGCRMESDILYRAELDKLAQNCSWFTYDICLSREDLKGTRKGYVHQVYLEKYFGDAENKRFYICGWSKMIDEAVENLILKLGCDRSQVLYELYG